MIMKTIIQIFTAGITSFLLTIVLIPVLKKIAIKINLVDKPNGRKIHQLPIPLIGGIAIALAIFLTSLINAQLFLFIVKQQTLFSTALVLLILGIIDDKIDLNAKYKLMIQLICALAIAFSGIRIVSLYGLFGVYEIPVLLQYILTMVIITGIVNAMNLMDGIDGLLGEISMLGFLILFSFSIYLKEYSFTALCISFVGSISGFLKFNLSNKKIFMGDAGSLFLGYILVSSSIYLLNNNSHSENSKNLLLISAIGFFALPVLDSIRVYLGRIKIGKSPFKADKTHIHHLLLLMNFSHKRIGVIITFISIVFLIYSLMVLNYLSLFWIILSIGVLFSIISLILNLNKKVIDWRDKIKELEK